ncbi:MAG: ATP synthase F1 subunit epsilon [Candidatus Woesebacteria bacterium]|jgi:F-type H+-transporting ATPase subunit epsilon
MPKLNLQVVSQEKELLSTEVDSLTVPTTTGRINILPKHIGLFSQLEVGELVYKIGTERHSIVLTDGFINVNPNNTVTVMVDSAVHARDISLSRAEKAIEAAKETMAKSKDQRELMMAEASLKRAMLEIKVAEKSKKRKV